MASSKHTADEGARDLPIHRIVFRLDEALAQRDMTLSELSRRTGITLANLSILKNNRAKAIRFSTLTLICDALEVEPGQLFTIAVPNTRKGSE